MEKTSKKAAKQQVKGQQAAIDTQKQYLGPFAEAGAGGINALQQFVDEGANFRDTQAFKDITNSSKANVGGLAGVQSGSRQTALAEFFATNFRPQRMAELGFLPQLGANAAGNLARNVGGLQQNIGDARAAGTIGQGNSFASGINALGSLNFSNLIRTNPLTSPLSASSQLPFSQQPQQPFGTFNTGIGPFGDG